MQTTPPSAKNVLKRARRFTLNICTDIAATAGNYFLGIT
jgi:hypothetical protein